MEWYDNTFGYYIISNKWMQALIGGSAFASASIGSILMYLLYNEYWCLAWGANGGNSKRAICPGSGAYPGTLTGIPEKP